MWLTPPQSASLAHVLLLLALDLTLQDDSVFWASHGFDIGLASNWKSPPSSLLFHLLHVNFP
jgi:hypothetical protein